MILKEYLKSGKHIIDDNILSTVSTFYNVNSIPWLSSSYIDIYERTIKAKYCLRELYETTESDIKELTTLMFLGNYDKYKHIYDLLLMSYNPLWNVDGTETTTRNLTDNKTSSNTGTNTLTHNTTDARTTGETVTHNTTDTTTYNTTDGKNSTDSRTTYDSNTFYDTDKTIDSMTKTGTEATARTGTVGTTGTDSTNHTGTETTQTSDSGTNAQTVAETIRLERQGNIGVVSTVKLATEEFDFAEKYRKFINIVCVDLVREITLSC